MSIKDQMARNANLDSKVYVGDLGNDASAQELEDAFGYYGPLKKVWVARRPPGFAFVEFEDPRDAEDACRAMDGKYGSRADHFIDSASFDLVWRNVGLIISCVGCFAVAASKLNCPAVVRDGLVVVLRRTCFDVLLHDTLTTLVALAATEALVIVTDALDVDGLEAVRVLGKIR